MDSKPHSVSLLPHTRTWEFASAPKSTLFCIMSALSFVTRHQQRRDHMAWASGQNRQVNPFTPTIKKFGKEASSYPRNTRTIHSRSSSVSLPTTHGMFEKKLFSLILCSCNNYFAPTVIHLRNVTLMSQNYVKHKMFITVKRDLK